MTRFLIASLLAFTAAPALAEPPAPVSSIVPIADLDLSTEAGQRKLDRRLSIAAREVCVTASPADLEGQNDVNRCFKYTLARLADERDQRVAAASKQPIEVAAR